MMNYIINVMWFCTFKARLTKDLLEIVFFLIFGDIGQWQVHYLIIKTIAHLFPFFFQLKNYANLITVSNEPMI